MTTAEKIQQYLKEGQAAVITTPFNRRYVLSFESSAGTVVITKHTATFIIDFRYFEMAQSAVKGLDIVLQGKLSEQVKSLLSAEGVKEMLLETEISVGELREFEERYGDYSPRADSGLTRTLLSLRSVKSEDELELMDKAQQITDGAFAEILNYIKPGVSELDITAELEYIMKKKGAVELAFATICASGENSSKPHAVPGNRKVQNGDFITLDFGARYEGYCSDMTRTVAVGSVSDEMKKVYDTVLAAQKAALSAAKAGIKGMELDSVARTIINEAGYEGCFGHGLGHSVGLEIHESPRASVGCDTVLSSGMLMTVEPGIYLSGRFGVRIEDMVVITEEGCRNFTKSPKELIIL